MRPGRSRSTRTAWPRRSTASAPCPPPTSSTPTARSPIASSVSCRPAATSRPPSTRSSRSTPSAAAELRRPSARVLWPIYPAGRCRLRLVGGEKLREARVLFLDLGPELIAPAVVAEGVHEFTVQLGQPGHGGRGLLGLHSCPVRVHHLVALQVAASRPSVDPADQRSGKCLMTLSAGKPHASRRGPGDGRHSEGGISLRI